MTEIVPRGTPVPTRSERLRVSGRKCRKSDMSLKINKRIYKQKGSSGTLRMIVLSTESKELNGNNRDKRRTLYQCIVHNVFTVSRYFVPQK